jgi:hypothetical protein
MALILVWGTPASAQVPPKPGQIAIASRASLLPAAMTAESSSSVIVSEIEVNKAEERHERIVNRVWIASMVALVAASGFDAGTSWGKLEANGLLASPDGTFGARGVSIKAGAAAAIIIPQILFRKHKELRTKFAFGNFAGAGVFTGVAIHNLGIAAPK